MIIKKIVNFYWNNIAKPIDYARHIGVKIGEHTMIAIRQWSTEPYLVTIGNHVQVTRNVSILTHGGGNSVRWKYPDFDFFGKVEIKDWAYIGASSIILPGVVIGEGALVAAGSVVTHSVPPHVVVAGNPARIICTTEEYAKKNMKYNLNSKNLSASDKRMLLESLSNDKFIIK